MFKERKERRKDPESATDSALDWERPALETAITLGEQAAWNVSGLIGERPNLDFALAILSQALGLPSGGALMIFSTSRTVGWVGHAIEQYKSDRLIRLRAR